MDGFICLPLSQPGCLARLSGWTGLFVSLCLPSFVSRCLPAWMPGTGWAGSFVSLCPSLDAWHGSLVDEFICLPSSPFICLPLSPSLAWCLARLSGWTCSFVSLCLPLCLFFRLSPVLGVRLSPSLPAWMPGTAFQAFPAWMSGIHLCPFICLHVGGCLARLFGWRVHSPFVSLHLSLVVSEPGCLARLCEWTDSFVFISPRLPAWMPGTALSQPGCLAMIVCSWCVPADHIGAFQVNTFFGNVGFQELARVAAMGFVWLSRV